MPKPKKSVRSKKRSPAAGKRSSRAVPATTAVKPSGLAPSSATVPVPPSTSASGKSGSTRGAAGKASAGERYARFVEAYLANGNNATQAAIAAGYSEKTARSQGARLLTRVDIGAALGERQQKLQQKYELTTERVLQELSRIALYDPRKLYHPDGRLKAVHELDDDTAAAIASVEVDEIGVGETVVGYTKKLKAWDKNAALEKAMKTLGMFKDGGPPPPPPNVNITLKLEPSEGYLRMIGK